MKKKLLDRRGAAIELAIMMMVFSIFITTIILTTALLQNEHKTKAQLGIEQDIFLEQLGEEFKDAVLSGNLNDWKIEYEGISVDRGTVVKHIWVKAETVKPTCETEGYTLYRCSLCDETKAEDQQSSVSHVFIIDDDYKNILPNCTTTGIKAGTCYFCGQYFETELPVEHKWEETVEKQPTCAEEGYKKLTCSECSETKDLVEIPPLGHSHAENDTGTILKNPTCTENGIVGYTCVACNEKYEQEIEVTGHTYGEYTITKAPTETKHGEREKTCSCGDKQIDDAHYWVDIESESIKATCTNKGMTVQSCAVCEMSQILEIEKTEHCIVDNVCTACGINEKEVRYNLIVLRLTKDTYMLHIEQVYGDNKNAGEEIQDKTDVTEISEVCSSGGTAVLKITISQIEGIYKITEWSKK